MFHILRSIDKIEAGIDKILDIAKLLPISIKRDRDEVNIEDKVIAKESEFLFEPDEATVLTNLLPLYLKVRLFSSFLESSFSEQFARRVAMKNATDASKDMINC